LAQFLFGLKLILRLFQLSGQLSDMGLHLLAALSDFTSLLLGVFPTPALVG
jgi:hypothetical protein